jgi:hypothetical protein
LGVILLDPAAFNANGIEGHPDGKLLIVHSARGELYLVNGETGEQRWWTWVVAA